eukprot:252377-Rhodomonas_salina.2
MLCVSCYAVSGTELCYAATGSELPYKPSTLSYAYHPLSCYALSGTGIAYDGIVLRACYAVSARLLHYLLRAVRYWPSEVRY